MPSGTKQPPPLFQVAWSTTKGGRTRTASITLGSSALLFLLLLDGARIELAKSIAKALASSLGVGR